MGQPVDRERERQVPIQSAREFHAVRKVKRVETPQGRWPRSGKKREKADAENLDGGRSILSSRSANDERLVIILESIRRRTDSLIRHELNISPAKIRRV